MPPAIFPMDMERGPRLPSLRPASHPHLGILDTQPLPLPSSPPTPLLSQGVHVYTRQQKSDVLRRPVSEGWQTVHRTPTRTGLGGCDQLCGKAQGSHLKCPCPCAHSLGTQKVKDLSGHEEPGSVAPSWRLSLQVSLGESVFDSMRDQVAA